MQKLRKLNGLNWNWNWLNSKPASVSDWRRIGQNQSWEFSNQKLHHDPVWSNIKIIKMDLLNYALFSVRRLSRIPPPPPPPTRMKIEIHELTQNYSKIILFLKTFHVRHPPPPHFKQQTEIIKTKNCIVWFSE